MNFSETFLEYSLSSTVSKNTIKMIGHHVHLRDVTGQSYPIYACTRANHASSSNCRYTYPIKYSEAAWIPSFSPNFIFRFLRYDKKSKGNVLSFKPLTASRAGEILKEKLEAIRLDSSRFSSHSFRSGGATSAANLNVPDRLFKFDGRWKSDSAEDGDIRD